MDGPDLESPHKGKTGLRRIWNALFYSCDGLSAALFGKVEVMEGEVTQTNFHQYPLARMRDMPSVEVAIVASPRPPSGVGEAALPGVAPALANAAFALTGQRVRRLPFADHDWSLPD